ncbi:MAG: hypothetical protein ACLFSQ_02455 [Candidatus Zixiibacteriota bacterium]
MEMSRMQIVDAIKAFVEENDNIIAAWEGGSAAYAEDDELSDLDLITICEDEDKLLVFEKFRDFLSGQYSIRKEINVPEPTWHGYSQSFFFIENAPEMFYIDFLVMEKSQKNNLVQKNRHGNAKIWFDPQNLIDTSPMPQKTIDEKCRESYEKVKDFFELMYIETKQEILRNRFIDAVAYYNGIISRIATLHNILHRPAKYEFGQRYYYREMPNSTIEEMEKLLSYKNIEELNENLEKSRKIYNKLCKTIDDKFSSKP